MARLTISLPDDLHLALKETAARRRVGLGDLVAESLVAYGVKTRVSAEELVRRARASSGLGEAEAIELAAAETRSARRRR